MLSRKFSFQPDMPSNLFLCQLKCYLNPRITHWALALVMGNREPHEAKKKSFDLGGNRTHDLRIRSTVTLPTELQGRTEKVAGSIPTEVKRFFSLPRVVPCFPLLGLSFMALSSTLIYTSELILCSTICVPSATRHNIHMYPYFSCVVCPLLC